MKYSRYMPTCVTSVKFGPLHLTNLIIWLCYYWCTIKQIVLTTQRESNHSYVGLFPDSAGSCCCASEQHLGWCGAKLRLGGFEYLSWAPFCHYLEIRMKYRANRVKWRQTLQESKPAGGISREAGWYHQQRNLSKQSSMIWPKESELAAIQDPVW